MKFKWKQGMAAIALSSAITLAMPAVTGAAASGQGKVPAWAAAEIATWQELGLLKGNQSGDVMANDSVKKTEFVTFLNRVFNFTEMSDQNFKDVPAGAWYASEISKAVAAGALVGGGNGGIAPLEVITREQAALIVFRLFQVPAASGSAAPFADDADISSWAKEAVYAMKASGYVEGTPQGAFQPKKALTRAEAVKMINNVMGKLVADGASHAGISGGNLVVNTAGGTLSDLNLTGNLYITPGVGEGDLTIANAQIDGTIYVNGGGDHSITLKDSKAKAIIIQKKLKPVRVVLSGATSVGGVDIRSGSRISLDAGATIGDLIANAGAQVDGEGTIESATINAPDVTLAQTPKKLTLNANEANVGGKVVKKDDGGSTPVVVNPGNGGNPGGNPGTNPPVDQPTKLYTYAEVASGLGTSEAENQVKRYIEFLQDPSYKPSVANPYVSVPNLTNAITFVDYQFTVKPSLFASLRGVNTSALDSARTTLWIGTDSGVTKITLSDNTMKNYTTEDGHLKDDRVLLIIPDGSKGIFAITAEGVSHIYQ